MVTCPGGAIPLGLARVWLSQQQLGLVLLPQATRHFCEEGMNKAVWNSLLSL